MRLPGFRLRLFFFTHRHSKTRANWKPISDGDAVPMRAGGAHQK